MTEKMTRDNIKEIFKSVLESNKNATVETIEILIKLIDSTLKYRDELNAKTGEILTAKDTRAAIDVYLEAVQTEILPGELDPKIDRLVKNWLTEINGASFNN